MASEQSDRMSPFEVATNHQRVRRKNCSHGGFRSATPIFANLATFSTISTVLVLCIGISSIPTINGYNIDLPSYVRHTRDPNSMFGFSIALHKGRNGYPQTNSLVVGAPKFDTSSFQQGVVEAGAVFRCGMNDGDCHLVRFDSSSNHRNTNGEIIERKSFQWFGATVTASKDNDLIVACAPRYVFHTMTPSKSLRYDPVGTCFTSRNFTQFKEVSPCRTNYWGYHRQGSCQAGFSAAISKNGERFFVGAPGSWYWQGQVYSISSDATFPYKPPYYEPFGTGGQTYSFDATRAENQVYSTTGSDPSYDDSYLGYSMTTGDFNGDGIDDVAIGMPRGAGLLGKIVVNGWNMANIFNITGRQLGEYFGYSLATSDVDGDGFDDLLIGAPMFFEPGNVKGDYDVGRVYVLLQGNRDIMNRWTTEHILDGYSTKGRFGLALSTLGDVNRDGYGDFAVGAPYDGPEGRGVVYIFHGSANGPLPKPSQIIKSEDIVEGSPYPKTFGFALSGGVDMDGNTYPDLAVGAYSSDQVYIFKSRPVAAVTAMTTFLDPSKLISLDDKNCKTYRDGRSVACTDIMTCWSYTGEYLPRSLEFDVSWVLDAKKTKTPRMFFLLDEGKNIRNLSISLPYGKTYCRNETVYLADSLQDKLTPLEVEMRYNLRSSRPFTQVIRRKRDLLEPVIDQDREIIQRDALNIQKNCGPDNICEPDLRLEVKTVDKYLLGSPEPLVFDVIISNMNEDAFEAAFYMVMPKDLDFKKVESKNNKTDIPVTCTAPSKTNNYTLKCDIGNPLPGQKVSMFKVIMIPSTKVGMAPSYDFYMEANSTNVEKQGSHYDNTIRKSIGIWVETDLAIEGKSIPEFENYKASDFMEVSNASREEDLGPQLVHVYKVLNHGPSIIEEAEIYIHYPYQTLGGDLLMYVTNQPETDGNIICDPLIYVNANNLTLDKNLVRKSYLEKIGAKVRNYGTAGQASQQVDGASHIEKSYGEHRGGSNVVSIGGSTTKLSAEEKRRLESEDALEVSGDASDIHRARANFAAGSDAGGAGGAGSRSYSSSWTETSYGSGPGSVVKVNKTSFYTDSQGRPQVFETSTEYVRNFAGPSNGFRSEMLSANYQEQPGLGKVTVQQENAEIPLTSGVHSTRGRIQMANSRGNSQAELPSHVHPSGSSGGAYRPHQPIPKPSDRVGSPASYNDLYGSQTDFGKVAQGGHGFQTSSLDLGPLQRANVDNELRTQSGNEGINSGGYKQYHTTKVIGSPQGSPAGYQQFHSSQSQFQGRPQTSSSNFHHSSSSSSSGTPYYGFENEDYYDEDNNQNLGPAFSQNQPQHIHNPQQQWTHTSSQRRLRRDIALTAENSPIDLSSPCRAVKCEVLRCVAKNLGKDDSVWIALRGRLVAKTMEKIAGNIPLNISTMAVSRVTKLPFIGEPKDDIVRTHEVFFKAVPEPTPIPDIVPLYVVVGAACAGALILLLLIWLLYKTGFFNRNRPQDHSMERQPLRNGYHGDEHL